MNKKSVTYLSLLLFTLIGSVSQYTHAAPSWGHAWPTHNYYVPFVHSSWREAGEALCKVLSEKRYPGFGYASRMDSSSALFDNFNPEIPGSWGANVYCEALFPWGWGGNLGGTPWANGTADFFLDVANAQPEVAPAKQSNSCPVGNPINVDNGNKYQRETDYISTGVHPLQFTRYYNSLTPNAASPDKYWRHSYDRKLIPEYFSPIVVHAPTSTTQTILYNDKKAACEQGWDTIKAQLTQIPGAQTQSKYGNNTCYIEYQGNTWGTVEVQNNAYSPGDTAIHAYKLERPNGRVIRFTRGASNNWGTDGTLKAAFKQTTTGFEYRDANGNVEVYDNNYRLIAINPPNGIAQTLSYDAQGQLTSVTDTFGRSLGFNYDGQNRLSSIAAPGSQSWIYGYASTGQLDTLTHPDATTRKYHYEDAAFPNALTGITDERGVRYSTYEYDNQGRATASYHANNATRVDIAYNADGTRTVTNSLGHNTTYTFITQLISAISGPGCIGCNNGNSTYQYDSQNHLIAKTQNGARTDYQNFTANNQPQTVIEAAGTPEARTITTQWHSTFRLPTLITEPGKVTNFTYDANGRLLTRNEQAIP